MKEEASTQSSGAEGKVEMAVLGSSSLISLNVSAEVKRHGRKRRRNSYAPTPSHCLHN